MTTAVEVGPHSLTVFVNSSSGPVHSELLTGVLQQTNNMVRLGGGRDEGIEKFQNRFCLN